MAMITYLPRDFKDWSDKQQAHLTKVQNLCAELISVSITKRISTHFGEDQFSARIISWIEAPVNRALLKDWMTRKGLEISPTLFTSSVEYSGMWPIAIKDLNIP